jgi:hypothetical protein
MLAEESPELGRLFDIADKLYAGCRAEIDAWRSRLSRSEGEAIERALSDFTAPWATTPYTALKPEFRDRARRKARSLDDLLDESIRLTAASRLNFLGQRLVQSMRSPEVSAEFQRIVELASGTAGAEGRRGIPRVSAGRKATSFPVLDDDDEDWEEDGWDAEDSDDVHEPGDDYELPGPTEFPSIGPREIEALLRRAAKESGTVFLKVRSSEGSSVCSLIAEDIRLKGGTLTLLGVLPSGEGRAIPLQGIQSAILAD